jgi:hypothetical protein
MILRLLALVMLTGAIAAAATTRPTTTAADGVAPKPLFRDPVFDGAADPVVIFNRAEKKWFMLYTNRRANVPDLKGVEWVHGTPIGIAESSDSGATWTYRGTADIRYGDEPHSYWAPDVVYDRGTYHMFLTYVPGMHADWSGTRRIVHLTSSNLLKWDPADELKLASDRTIDATVVRLADGAWRLWYNNEVDRKSIYFADSDDLAHWRDRGKAIGDQPGEGPKVFRWHGRYWMIVDVWDGLGVYASDDAEHWDRQSTNLLRSPGKGEDDGVKGQHADVVVSGERAFLFYFTHPGRGRADAKKDSSDFRRSSIQVVELQLQDGALTCDRDAPTHVRLTDPTGEQSP